MHTITVSCKNSIFTIEYDSDKSKSLSDILKSNGIVLNTSCGGNSYCGKCLVNIDSYPEPVKACSIYPNNNISVIIPDNSLIPSGSFVCNPVSTNSISSKIYAAIDIGSTSITVCLTDGINIIDSDTFFNSTIKYGSDIISRILASNNGACNELSTLLNEDINSALNKLLMRNKTDKSKLIQIIISCNNTMQHLLLGLDTNGLASYPFTPFKTSFETDNNQIIIPSFSAFIGGDIMSGLYSIDALNLDCNFLLLDLGTNAEMVLGTNGRLLCTSAAAGPAFEASSLSCGTAAVAGAINHITLKKLGSKYKSEYSTIGNKLPVGICGSGVLELIASLLDNGIIDETGTLSDSYIDNGFEITRSQNGYISLTNQDIREIQLAISAIKTGILLLLKNADLKPSDIDKVYLSGSFGTSLDISKLGHIGLLPLCWINSPDTIIASGNTSLNGAIKYINDPDAQTYISNIINKCQEIHLSNEPDFNELFLNNINFSPFL